jgi:drug/metabolite transporter (DMT)-like permease
MDAVEPLHERTALRGRHAASRVRAGTLMRLCALYACWGVPVGVLLLGEPVSPLAGAGAAVALPAVVAHVRARPATA